MKAQLVFPMTIVVSVALLGVMKLRQKEHDRMDRRSRFENIKLRVTSDVLGEYENDRIETQVAFDKTQAEAKVLEEEVNRMQQDNSKKKAELDVCQGGQKSVGDDIASVETEFSNVQAESNKERDSWNTEIATLKQQLETRSAVCNFLKPGQDVDRKLCGEVIAEAPKPEPKADAPEPKEPKADAPEPKEPKADAPEPEKPKGDDTEPEEPKAKAEAPKAEAEAPKPKAEAPKVEASKKK